MLRAMLDSHPALAIPPESHFLRAFLRDDLSPREFLSLLAEHPRFEAWGLSVDAVAAAFERDRVSDPASAIRSLYATYAAEREKSRWGDKTPGYVKKIKGLADLLPESRFIHIIRDGRDVALSWLQTAFAPSSIEDAAERWRRAVRAGRRDGQHLGDRYLEVRYEELVGDPEAVLRSVCAFVELSFDAAMLDHTQHASEIIGSTFAPESHRRLQQPATVGLRDWRREMDPADALRFQRVAGGLLEELDYQLVI